MIRISIIIVSWNAKAYLLNCVRSLLEDLSGIPSEIIVVDNASTDGSAEAVEELGAGIVLLRNSQNLGFARANNSGIAISKGKYVCLVNSDVIVHDGCFESITKYMDEHKSVGVLGPRTLNGDGTLQHSSFSHPNPWNTLCRALALDTLFPRSPLFGKRLMKYWTHDQTRPVDALNGCFLMVRDAAIKDVGPLDESFFIYGEDLDWCKRFGNNGWGVVFFHEAVITHFGGASSANAPIRFFLEMNKADLQYWVKHHGKSSKLIYILLTILHQSIRIFGSLIILVILPSRKVNQKYHVKRGLACLKWACKELFANEPRFSG